MDKRSTSNYLPFYGRGLYFSKQYFSYMIFKAFLFKKKKKSQEHETLEYNALGTELL